MAAALFGILSSITIVFVYVIYLKGVRSGDITPNPSTWSIWLVVNFINSATYLSITKNIWEGLITIVVSCLVFCLFLYSLVKNRFSSFGLIDATSFFVAIGVGIFWRVSGDPRTANLALQFVFVVSYVPTLSGLVRGVSKEKPLPWALAALAFIFSSLGIISEWSGDWAKLAYPAINGILGNGSVAVVSVFKKPAK